MARWLSRDPIGENGGINLLCILGNNVIYRIDYLGRDEVLIFDGNDPGGPGRAGGQQHTDHAKSWKGESSDRHIINAKDYCDATHQLASVFAKIAKDGGKITQIRLLDHGVPGSQSMGNSEGSYINEISMENDAVASALTQFLDKQGTLMFCGCSVAGSKDAEEWVRQLAKKLNRKIIAFKDPTFWGNGRGWPNIPGFVPPPAPREILAPAQ
jgi:hypothetical protein